MNYSIQNITQKYIKNNNFDYAFFIFKFIERKKFFFDNVNVNHPILNIEKNYSMEKLIIIEEKYLDNEKKKYLINYEIKNMSEFNLNNIESIPSSK